MVRRTTDYKSSIIGALVICIIFAGAIYPIYYATANNLWSVSFPNFNGFNFNREQHMDLPERFSRIVYEANMSYSESYKNLTRISIVVRGNIIGLSVKWTNLKNIIWKLTAKAPTEGDYEVTTTIGFKDSNHTTLEFNLSGDNVTYYLLINENYTVLDSISDTITNMGYLNVEYAVRGNKTLLANDIVASFKVGNVVLNLKNSRIQSLDIHPGVGKVQVLLQNTEIENLLRIGTNVGDIDIEGNNLKVASDTEITANTGSITFSVNNLTYNFNSTTTCYITSDVGDIVLNITLSNTTDARVEATTDIGSISYNGTGIRVIEKKKTEVIIETNNYSTSEGIKFNIAANVGSIEILVIKQ